MKKIILLREQSEGDDLLVSCLRIMFPECEIQVRSKEVEPFGPAHLAPNLAEN